MLKLMKYEFRKQLFTKFAMLVVLGLLELYFLYGLVIKDEITVAKAEGFLIFYTFAAILFVSFECIVTFHNDLRTKQSYMLFMVPESTYSVVGAKVLSAMIQILLTALLFGAVAFLDVFAMAARLGQIDELLKILNRILNELFRLDVNAGKVAIVLASIVTSWFAVVVIAMLSITLSATFMANSKLRTIVSFVVFLAISIAVSKLRGVIIENLDGYTKYAVGILLSLVISAGAYIGTAWMLHKKVCV